MASSSPQNVAGSVPYLTLFNPTPPPSGHTGRWRINGYPATIVLWTDEEWSRLEQRPADAQYMSCGVWCALRIDD